MMNLLILQKRTWPSLAYHQISETWGRGFDPNDREDILGSRSDAILSYSESGIGVEDRTRGR